MRVLPAVFATDPGRRKRRYFSSRDPLVPHRELCWRHQGSYPPFLAAAGAHALGAHLHSCIGMVSSDRKELAINVQLEAQRVSP
jgi:hypothetical protein